MPGPITADGEAPSTPNHIELVENEEQVTKSNGPASPPLTDSKGWDGKLRIDRTAMLQNPEAISDPEYSDDENVLGGEEISADEGKCCPIYHNLKSKPD